MFNRSYHWRQAPFTTFEFTLNRIKSNLHSWDHKCKSSQSLKICWSTTMALVRGQGLLTELHHKIIIILVTPPRQWISNCLLYLELYSKNNFTLTITVTISGFSYQNTFDMETELKYLQHNGDAERDLSGRCPFKNVFFVWTPSLIKPPTSAV